MWPLNALNLVSCEVRPIDVTPSAGVSVINCEVVAPDAIVSVPVLASATVAFVSV